MKVAFFTSPISFSIFGGAEIQILKTKEYLDHLNNCSVDLFDIFIGKIEQYDIFHNFNMWPDTLLLYRLAKKKGVKLVLSPIYWENRSLTFKSLVKKALRRSRLRNYFPPLKRLYPTKDFLDLADIILPNSKAELKLLTSEFKMSSQNFYVVPNGVDKVFYEANPNIFTQEHGLEDFVLFVGRIELRKNIVNLLKAFKTLEMPLVLIGHANCLQHEYFILCRKLMKSNKHIHYIGFIPHESALLRSAYASAKVFVLPSLYETPGLTALEAGLAGCNIVITKNGSTREYFKDYAWYVDPNSVEDIKAKILEAYSSAKNQKLRKLILKNYTWEKVAEKTLDAYKKVLENA